MINTWGKEEITKLNYEFRQDGIYDKICYHVPTGDISVFTS